jgi:hypothetical protein
LRNLAFLRRRNRESLAASLKSARFHAAPTKRVYYDEEGLALQEETMRSLAALCLAFFSVTSAIAHEQDQTVSVGPWTIVTSFKAERFDSCTMSRSADNLNITFVRSHDGLLLLLDSSKWKLDRGKAYDVVLVATSRSVQAKALAETKSVTIALPDRPLGERVRTANILEVKGEGATLRVPLDASAVALERLDSCFEKNSRRGVESNPFVAPSRKP